MTVPAEGDREDFDRQVAEMEPIYFDVLYHVDKYAKASTRTVERALEITQEIAGELWLNWITHLSSFVPPESNKAYAEQAVRFHKMDDLRSKAARDEVIDADADVDELEVASAEDPHGEVVDAELQQQVDAATAGISKAMLLAWEMRTIGHPYEEIAEALSITQDAARLQYSRANKRLRTSRELKAYLKEER
jgi:RNA polymerase sigma factor (sigma-70 family)